MKIKVVILIAAICFAIIPMAARVFLTDYFIKGNSVEEYRDEVKSMASNQVSGLNAMLGTARADMNMLTSHSSMNTATSDTSAVSGVEDFIAKFQENNVMITSIRLVDLSSGTVIAGDGKGRKFENYEKYEEYDDDMLYFDDVIANTSNKTMFIKKKMNNCLVIISYNISTSNSLISKALRNTKFDLPDNKSAGQVIIADANGNWSAGSGFYENLESRYTSAVTSQIAGLQDGAVTNTASYKDSTGAAFLYSMVRIGGEHGLVAIASCNDSINGLYYNSTATPVMVASVLIAVIAIVGAIIASNAIAKPLKMIENTLEKVRRGDHEARIGTISNNEYGQLSRSFNNLVDEIVVSEDRYKTISDMSDNIIFEWNFKTNEVVFSNNFNKKFSYRPPSDHFGDSFLLKAKIHPDDADRYRNDLDALEKGTNFERNEYRIKNIYGDFIWVLMRTSTLKDKDGKPLKVVGVMVDIDRAKKSEQQLTERASYDALTELYNRETIETQIDNEISLSEMRKTKMAVLFIDVDDFKHYNDNYSHATGDQVLKFVAKTIKESVGDMGFAGRYGGDEFIAMVRDAETNEPALIAQKIIDTLGAGFDADIGEHLTVSVSIGIAVIQDDYNTRVEYLIGKADDAMYSVKKSGKSNYAFI